MFEFAQLLIIKSLQSRLDTDVVAIRLQELILPGDPNDLVETDQRVDGGDAVAAGEAIPVRYLSAVTQYGVLYQVAILSVSILLFEARELK